VSARSGRGRLWDLEAGAYHGLRRLPGLRFLLDAEKRNLASLLARVEAWPRAAVDVGTGAGSSLDLFPPGVRVTALDRSPAMLRRARLRRPVTAVLADASRLPLRDGSVRFLAAVGLTEYLADHVSFVAGARRALAPGGYFLVTVSPKGALNALRRLLGHRLHPADPGEWEDLVAASGFECLGKKKSLIQAQYLYRAP
jgi:SAM-dependent methyltransferase